MIPTRFPKYHLLFFACLAVSSFQSIEGFAATPKNAEIKEGGWKTRPAVPELAESNSSNKPTERIPWDGFRFLKQSSQFVSLPKPFQNKGAPKIVYPGDVIWEPSSNSNIFRWGSLDDVVMGGASESEFDNATGTWKGTVTSANNGGFVGIRSTPFAAPLNMKKCKGFEFKLRGGDGKRFKAVIRDSTDFNGVCWTTSFDAPKSSLGGFFSKGENKSVGSVKIPFSKQIPTIFARTVPDQTFDVENVVGLQVAYSKFEYDGDLNPNFALGDFDLQLMEVRAI